MSEKHNIWWVYDKEENYHCNQFGIVDGDGTSKSKPTLFEINCSIRAERTTTKNSLFAKDGNNRYYIVRIKPVNAGKGKTIPLDRFEWCEERQICNQDRSGIVITDLNDKKLVENLGQFVQKVHDERAILASAHPKNSPERPPVQEEPGKPTKPYLIQNIVDDGCFLKKSRLEGMLGLLRRKGNLILQGPPGTGKTWLAKRLAYALMEEKDNTRIQSIQFHPNISYEDFVRGWRPTGGKDNSSNLELVDGPFLKMIDKAKNSKQNFVMVIEEINRGNPANIFGEMLTLLEADKRKPEEALMLGYMQNNDELGHVPSELVYIPDNLYVIGTMNVADRSIALVDLALRRRFGFCYLEPVFEKDAHVHLWKDWVNKQCGIPEDTLGKIADNLKSLNRAISEDELLGPHFMIGHSYVTPDKGCKIDDPKEWFENVVDYEIRPLLEEYWITNRKKVDDEAEKLKRL